MRPRPPRRARLHAGERDLECLGQGVGGQRHYVSRRGAHNHRVLLEQGHGLTGVLRQQLAVGIQRLGLEAAGSEEGGPLVHELASHHRDRDSCRLPLAAADGEMQIFDVLGELLLERKRHECLQLGARLGRGQLRLRQQDVRARHQHDDVPPGRARRGERQRSAVGRAGGGAAPVDHEPGRLLLRRTRKPEEEPVSHGASY